MQRVMQDLSAIKGATQAFQQLRDTDSGTPFFSMRRLLLQIFSLKLLKNGVISFAEMFNIEAIMTHVNKLSPEEKEAMVLEQLLPEHIPYVSYINYLLTTAFSATVESTLLNEEEKKQKTVAIVHRLINYIYRTNSHMLSTTWYMFFDDIQNADEYTRMLFMEQMEDTTRPDTWVAHDLLLVVSVNTDSNNARSWVQKLEARADHVITLDFLEKSDTEKLMIKLYDQNEIKKVRSDLLDMIYQKSDNGNPQMIAWMVQYLIDKKQLMNVDSILTPVGNHSISELEVPSSLATLTLQKIDRLPPNANLVIKIASLLGRWFSYQLLEAVFPAELKAKKELQANLELLVSQGMLEKANHHVHGEGYLFREALVRDKAYSLLIASQKKKLHRKAANFVLQVINERYEGRECTNFKQDEADDYTNSCLFAATHIVAGYEDYDPLQVDESDTGIESYEEPYQVAAKIEKLFPHIRRAVDRFISDGENVRADKLQTDYITLIEIYMSLLAESTDTHSLRLMKMEAHQKAFNIGKLVDTRDLSVSKKHIGVALELCPKDHKDYFALFATNWFLVQWIGSGTRVIEDVAIMLDLAKKIPNDPFPLLFSYTASTMANYGVGNLETSIRHANKALQVYFRDPDTIFQRSVASNFSLDSATTMSIFGNRNNLLLGNYRSAYSMSNDAKRFMQERYSERSYVINSSFLLYGYAFIRDFKSLEEALVPVKEANEKFGSKYALIWVQSQLYFAYLDAWKAVHEKNMSQEERIERMNKNYKIAVRTVNDFLLKNANAPNMIFPLMAAEVALLKLRLLGPDLEVIDFGISMCDYMQKQISNVGLECYRVRAEFLLFKKIKVPQEEKQIMKQVKELLNTGITIATKTKSKTILLRALETRAKTFPTRTNIQALQEMYCSGFEPSQIIYELEDIKSVQKTLAALPEVSACPL